MKKLNKPVKLSDQAYETLKTSILSGDLKARESLPEEKFAKRLGISRTPFRDALVRLANEGLVIQRPGSPFVVAEFTHETSLEIMEIRKVLEIHNLECVISRISSTDINELEHNLKLQAEVIKKNDFSKFMDYDKEFHAILIRLNTNERLKNLIMDYNTDISRSFLILSNTVPESANDAFLEHVEILNEIKNRNLINARTKMIIHLDNVEKRFLNYLDQ